MKRRAVLQVAILVVLAALVCVYELRYAQHHRLFDLRIYRDAMVQWVDGGGLYTPFRPDKNGLLGFTYPPFAAVLMLPFAFVPWGVTATVVTVGNAVALVVTTLWIVRPVAARHGWPLWFSVGVTVAAAAVLEPIWQTFSFGQIGLFLAVLVLGDLLLLTPRGSRWAGVGVGLAMAIKLTPGVFLIYLLVTRRWRAAVTAVAAAAAATLLTAAVAPRESWQFWTKNIFESDRVGRNDYTSNQSLRGLLARLFDAAQPPGVLWLVITLAVSAYGLWCASRAVARGDELTGVTLAGLVSVAASPISWTHHIYWVVPALVLLAGAAADLRGPRGVALGGLGAATIAIMAGQLVWRVGRHDPGPGQHYDWGVAGVLAENSYALLVLVLLAVLPGLSRPSVYRTSANSAPPTRKTSSAPSATNPNRS